MKVTGVDEVDEVVPRKDSRYDLRASVVRTGSAAHEVDGVHNMQPKHGMLLQVCDCVWEVEVVGS